MPSNEMHAGRPEQHVLQFIGGKWQMSILWHLRMGKLRFNAIKEALPGLSEKVLTANLKFFEEKGIIQKQIFATMPPKTEYSLTSEGLTLMPVIEKILLWGHTHLQEKNVHHITPADLPMKYDLPAPTSDSRFI